MRGRFQCTARVKQLCLLAVFLVSLLVRTTTATARCYNPGAIASHFEEQLKEEQALTAKSAYTGVFDPGQKVQIGLLRWYDPNLQRWINRDPMGEAGGINLYRFNLNSPLSFVDADGMWPTGLYGSPNVHGNSITRVLGNRLPQQDINILINQQIRADLDQSPGGSFKHGMRNGADNEKVQDALLRANNYVREKLKRAQDAECNGNHVRALKNLGLAMHALQDSTSPEHNGFRPWMGHGNDGRSELGHGLGELFDPGAGSNLDSATQAAYDYFTGAQPMPDNFFTFGPDKGPPPPASVFFP